MPVDPMAPETSRVAPASRAPSGSRAGELELDLAGLDALAVRPETIRSRGFRRVWRTLWPKLTAVGVLLIAWQAVVWTGWNPSVLQAPGTVAHHLWVMLGSGAFWAACRITAERAALGYIIAVMVGAVVGTAVARTAVLRAAIGSLITGIQTMPSVLWYPLAVMVFGTSSRAIILMMVLGSSSAVANGCISGIDQVPPALIGAGRILGAEGIALQRHVVLPAALPSMLAGLKQGWAFAWHALMAGEFLIQIGGHIGLGGRTETALHHHSYATVVALMIVIVAVGVGVDLVFARADAAVRQRHGLVGAS